MFNRPGSSSDLSSGKNRVERQDVQVRPNRCESTFSSKSCVTFTDLARLYTCSQPRQLVICFSRHAFATCWLRSTQAVTQNECFAEPARVIALFQKVGGVLPVTLTLLANQLVMSRCLLTEFPAGALAVLCNGKALSVTLLRCRIAKPVDCTELVEEDSCNGTMTYILNVCRRAGSRENFVCQIS